MALLCTRAIPAPPAALSRAGAALAAGRGASLQRGGEGIIRGARPKKIAPRSGWAQPRRPFAMALAGSPATAQAALVSLGTPPEPPALVAPNPGRTAPAPLAAPANGPGEKRLSVEERQVVGVFKENTPSVVNITSLARVSRTGSSLDVMEVPQGTGTGVVWDKQGRVVTNFHVVRQASDVLVTMSDGSVFGAELLGFDEDKDVAVLQLGPPPTAAVAQKMGMPEQKLPPFSSLRPIVTGGSSDLVVGQTVYAIGNPFGLDHTLTSGIISGLGRELGSGNTGRPIKGVVQTDAAINPGNSGGPLLDRTGDLIGINTAIVGQSNSGVGFAIPVDTVKSVVDQVLKYGEIRRPILGITIAPETMLRKYTDYGVLVMDVPEGSPAEAAGIMPTRRDAYGRYVMGDIIVGVNGKPVKGSGDLLGLLDDYKPGDRVKLEVLRAVDPYEPLRRTRKAVSVELAARVTKFNKRAPAAGFE